MFSLTTIEDKLQEMIVVFPTMTSFLIMTIKAYKKVRRKDSQISFLEA